jgi:hypothetical protein
MAGAGDGSGDATGLRFAYHRSVAPMVWILVACGMVELIVTHTLIAFWNTTVALVLSVLTLSTLGWLVRGLLLMKRRPVLLGGGRLVMQVGSIRRIDVSIAGIVGVRTSIDAFTLKQRSVLNLALLAYPNVIVDLGAPLPGRRGIVAIAHRLDDPAAFATALERLRTAS